MRLPNLFSPRPSAKQDPEAHWFYPAMGGAVLVVGFLLLLCLGSVLALGWSLP